LPLPLRFLLLPPRQLSQLLHHGVHLLVGLLLLRALRRLVLIGQLVQILLEEVREIFGDRSRAAAPATTAASAALLAHLLLILFFRFLQLLQRAILRRQRVVRRLALQLFLRGLHLLGGLRQQLRDLQERRIG